MSILDEMSATYVWWKGAHDPSLTPRRVLAQVMDIGDFDDVITGWAWSSPAIRSPRSRSVFFGEALHGAPRNPPRAAARPLARARTASCDGIRPLRRHRAGLASGHRESVDFDFFCGPPLDKPRIFGTTLLANADVVQDALDDTGTD
jgi:hypothetical protein